MINYKEIEANMKFSDSDIVFILTNKKNYMKFLDISNFPKELYIYNKDSYLNNDYVAFDKGTYYNKEFEEKEYYFFVIQNYSNLIERIELIYYFYKNTNIHILYDYSYIYLINLIKKRIEYIDTNDSDLLEIRKLNIFKNYISNFYFEPIEANDLIEDNEIINKLIDYCINFVVEKEFLDNFLFFLVFNCIENEFRLLDYLINLYPDSGYELNYAIYYALNEENNNTKKALDICYNLLNNVYLSNDKKIEAYDLLMEIYKNDQVYKNEKLYNEVKSLYEKTKNITDDKDLPF